MPSQGIGEDAPDRIAFARGGPPAEITKDRAPGNVAGQDIGKRALVTGSSSGIGEAIAKLLAAEGVAVVVHGRDESRANAVAEAIRAGRVCEWRNDPRRWRHDSFGYIIPQHVNPKSILAKIPQVSW